MAALTLSQAGPSGTQFLSHSPLIQGPDTLKMSLLSTSVQGHAPPAAGYIAKLSVHSVNFSIVKYISALSLFSCITILWSLLLQPKKKI